MTAFENACIDQMGIESVIVVNDQSRFNLIGKAHIAAIGATSVFVTVHNKSKFSPNLENSAKFLFQRKNLE